MTASLSTFNGQAIYLDTMVPYALFRSVDPLAETFFSRLESNTFLAYTSVLTFDELAYHLLLALIKDRYDGSPLDNLRNQESHLIAEFAPSIVDRMNRLRNFSQLVVLDISASDLDFMNKTMIQYHLRPRDALHLAAMQRVQCFDLASNDQHFDRVPYIRRFTL
jgi:predicted nucleic acid-binding protein